MERRKKGAIYLWGNEAKVLFTEIELYNEDTDENICFPDAEVMADKIPVLLKEDAPQNFTLKFHAREVEGFKGFRVYFAWKNEKNRMGWVLGGWENQDAALMEEIDGKECFLTQNEFSLEKNREYNLELHVSGKRIEGWIDGKMFQSVELVSIEKEPLYFTASREDATSDLIFKAVNLRSKSFETKIELAETENVKYLCDVYLLKEEACVENPDFPGVEIVDIEKEEKVLEFTDSDKKFMWEFPERSVTVMRLKGPVR